jgi:5'-phosphate synthase pdxT subunit
MNNNFIQIGILDIQGSVAEHAQILKDLKQDFIYVKSRENLKNITHLIIPGGESTTIIKLLNINNLLSIFTRTFNHTNRKHHLGVQPPPN